MPSRWRSYLTARLLLYMTVLPELHQTKIESGAVENFQIGNCTRNLPCDT